MKSQKKTLVTALCVGIVTSIIVMSSGSKAPESCLSFREQLKQLATNDSGLSGAIIAGVVPEHALDQVLDERFGALTDKECNAMLPEINAGLEALPHTAWASKMRAAGDASVVVIKECKAKRVSGEIKTHAESAQCSNPKITDAFTNAGYPYADLLKKFTDKRLEEAEKVDKAMFGDAEDQKEFAKTALEIVEQERLRNKK
jgi:hypothetical protein